MIRPPKDKRDTMAEALPSEDPPTAPDLVLSLTPAEFERLLIALSTCRTLHLSLVARAHALRRRKCSTPHRHQWCRVGKHIDHKRVETKFG